MTGRGDGLSCPLASQRLMRYCEGAKRPKQADLPGHCEHPKGAWQSCGDCFGCASQRHCVTDCFAEFTLSEANVARNDNVKEGTVDARRLGRRDRMHAVRET